MMSTVLLSIASIGFVLLCLTVIVAMFVYYLYAGGRAVRFLRRHWNHPQRLVKKLVAVAKRWLTHQ